MTVRDDLLPLVYSVRAIPGQFGLRVHTVDVRVTTWTGAHPGDGAEYDVTTTPITESDGQPPKVRFLTDEEIAVGQLATGTVEVGPITPSHGTDGGTDLAVLKPEDEGTVVHYILTGPEFPTGAVFERHAIKTDRALHYMLTLRPVSEK